jgi:hypothetical protein
MKQLLPGPLTLVRRTEAIGLHENRLHQSLEIRTDTHTGDPKYGLSQNEFGCVLGTLK